MRLAALLLSLWIAALSATEPPLCYEACTKCLQALRFDDNVSERDMPGSARSCTNVNELSSLYLCLDAYCMLDARVVGLNGLNQTCQGLHDVSIPGFDLIAHYTPEDVSRLRRVELEDSKKSETIKEVVVPSKTFFDLWFGTLDSVAVVHYYHYAYGATMMVFWAVVVGIGMLNHFVSAISEFQMVSRQPCGPINKIWNSFAWMRSSMVTPAAFGYRCSQKIGWGTVPPRLQSLTLLTFLIINIVFSIHGYRIFPGNIYFSDPVKQILRYVSDRTGIISFANFPVIWLFGMRNNLLMWLTGWDFGTYNNFHRWVARIATVQAIVHSVGYTVLILKDGGWTYFLYWWGLWFWWAGQLATVIMSLLLGFSFYWIRRQHYETFLIIHIVMSVLTLFFMSGHVSIFNGRYDPLFWIPVYIWLLDRVLRALRILTFNPKFWNTLAGATYDPSSNIVRLTVPWSTSFYRPAAGTYYYIHVLNDSRFWESHPFTVASVSDEEQSSTKLLGEQVPLLEQDDLEAIPETLDSQPSESTFHPMTFLIRPYDSFTARLRDRASSAWPQKAPVRVLVDGPYGHTQPLHLFSTVLFVVGGSGVVVPLSYLRSLATSSSSSSSSPSSVRIHWAVREPAFALSVLQTDIGDLLGAYNLSLDVYITTHAARDIVSDWPSQVTLHSGRIDARSVVETTCEKANEGSVAVVACGPGQMADDARRTVVEMLGRGRTRIEYFEEAFQW